ncbi:hypothetical protein CN97_10850 [Haematobacter massiliensis]|uniref:Uncharacterized protein n=1 Tax=Haematobacter massiliensis TaxID=195105 RepID=A0A086YB40_9RHOB|nr:hypothetical protein [Haematobacter massiliensis]KFI31490.1 hypothetical protein CN97_10850 [Haematobacter massiliensis]
MSAPNTNIEKQTRRHRGPLIGMMLVVIFAVGIIFFWLARDTANAPGPDGADVQIDGRTGAPVQDQTAPATQGTVTPGAPTSGQTGTPGQSGPAGTVTQPATPTQPQPQN